MGSRDTFLVNVAQCVGVTTSALCAGSNWATSLYAIPSILKAPPKLLSQQWLELYDRGIVVVVPLAVASGTAFAYLAYASSRGTPFAQNPSAQLYATAGVFAVGFAPYTRLLMWKGIEELKSIAASPEGPRAGQDIQAMVRAWSTWNLGRGILPFVASVLGIWTAVSRPH